MKLREVTKYKDVGLVLLIIIQTALIVLRVNDYILISYWLVFLPTLIYPMMLAMLWIVVFLYFLYKNLTFKTSLRKRLRDVEDINKDMRNILNDYNDGND